MSTAFRRRRLARLVGLYLALVLGVAVASAQVPDQTPAASAVQPGAVDTSGPLELTKVSLAQRDVRMSLRIETSGAWSARELGALPGRGLCMTLVPRPSAAAGRICVTTRSGRTALSYALLAPDGSARVPRRLAAKIWRPSPHVLQASFLPVAAGLSVGSFSWWVSSTWTGPAPCVTACDDRLPDEGALAGEVAFLGAARCFGAASRNPRRGCRNDDLRASLQPPLRLASQTLHPFCDDRDRTLITVCWFGASPGEQRGHFALIGDSHVGALKTALAVVSLAKRWRGASIQRAACPATQASHPILPTPARSRQCARWNDRALRWLSRHPEITTVFLSTHVSATVRADAGMSAAQARSDGYRREIQALLGLVRDVVVIRDTPSEAPNHLRCVEAALQDGRSPGPACARPREQAVRPDPLAATAKAMRSPRVKVVDLTRQVCDARRCYPVVGGALVHRDRTHMTPAFSASLGPFILRALKR